MSTRTSVAIVIVGVAAIACSAAPTPSEPAPPVEAAAPTTLSQPVPDSGVNWLRVEPQEGLRNARLSLDVACLDILGTVRSPVLDIGALQPDPAGHQPWHLTGSATVRSDAALGRYPISVTCGTETLSTEFTVVPTP
jgi:hypothetical protein